MLLSSHPVSVCQRMSSRTYRCCRSLLRMVRMVCDLPEADYEDHQRKLVWLTELYPYLRKDHPYITDPLLVSTATMSVSSAMSPPQVFQRDVRDTWQVPIADKTEPHPQVDLYGKGCLWRASKPDDGPFNGIFHAPNECCRYCTLR